MEIKPIKTETDYLSALKEIERLFDAEPDTPEGDRLEILVTLVEAYEEKHYPIPLPDPVSAIEYHMESRGLTRKDLEPYIGRRARVSEILNRRRPLSLNMIRKLEAGLGIPAEILIQPYELTAPGMKTAAAETLSRPGAHTYRPMTYARRAQSMLREQVLQFVESVFYTASHTEFITGPAELPANLSGECYLDINFRTTAKTADIEGKLH